MKKLLMTLLLVPSLAFGYTPTYGCFVENYTVVCSDKIITCDYSADHINQNLLAFGTTVGTLCNVYDECLISYVTMHNAYNKKLALIKRLRAACGARCRTIK
jgi:hypothetical protein